MAASLHELRPKTGGDSEKITINLGYVDLGHVDLLVQEGFYSNRTDFIRTAIRNQIERHAEAAKRSVERKSLDLGLRHYTRGDLEAAVAAGRTLDIRVLGLASIAADVSPELARAARSVPGSQTVLFLHALAKSNNGFDGSLFAGLGVAALALAAMFVAMQWLALRLPLRPMFVITSAFLFVMGLKLVGEAFQEFQEQTLVSVHDGGVPAFVTEIGFNGTWEAIGTQAVLVARAEARDEAGLERLKAALAAQLEASGLDAPDFSGENAGH